MARDAAPCLRRYVADAPLPLGLLGRRRGSSLFLSPENDPDPEEHRVSDASRGMGHAFLLLGAFARLAAGAFFFERA
jgi:hypothetical protein